MYRNLRFKPHDSLDATDFHGRGPAHWPTFYVEFKDSYDLNLMVGILFDLGIFFYITFYSIGNTIRLFSARK